MRNNDLQLLQLSWWFYHNAMVYNNSTTNGKNAEPQFLMPTIPYPE